MPGNFIQFDQMPTAGRNKSTEKQIEELRNYIKGVMDQLRYELRRIGNTETSGRGNTGGNGSRADTFGYPVGSVYISTRETNPTTLFGGTWVRLPDRFLLGAGETFEAGNTGGEDGIERFVAGGSAGVDFVDDDDRVLDLHSDQRQEAQERHESEGLVEG